MSMRGRPSKPATGNGTQSRQRNAAESRSQAFSAPLASAGASSSIQSQSGTVPPSSVDESKAGVPAPLAGFLGQVGEAIAKAAGEAAARAAK